jgi:hypothetical protein
VDQVVFYTQSGLVSLAPSTGKVLWRYGLFYNGISIGASPVVVSNLVYWSAAYGTGAGTVRITASGTNQTAALAWQKPGALQNHWGTPVHLNGYLYGIYGQSLTTLKCVELATGTEKWSRGGVGFGNVLAVGGNILTLTDTGELILSSPDPQSYTEIATFRPLTGKCWNSAGINNGRIFVRSSLEAVCVDVSLPAPPPLEMQSELAEDGALFRVRVANRDGSAIQAERITRIGIYSHDDLSVPAAGWTPVAGAPVLIDGKLEYAEPVETGKPIRVYRVEEQP